MVVKCDNCAIYYDDEFRTTICPHETFMANDGKNNFKHYMNSYISNDPPKKWYYINWTYEFKSRCVYGLIINSYGIILATPLFALFYCTQYSSLGPRFSWGIWRRKDVIEGDFLYRYHN